MDDRLSRELNTRSEFLKKIIREKTAALADVPEGKLRCVNRGNRIEYYHRRSPSDATGIYIPAGKRDMARALAQKSYDQMILKYAQEELRCIDLLAKKRESNCLEGLYESYGLSRKALVDPIWLPDDEFIAGWLNKDYKRRGFDENAPVFYTSRNERMRSKTEILISDILVDLGAPYLYEYPVFLRSRGWVFPDFTVLNVRTREIRYWEHLGKMDNPAYCEDNLDKILAYERDGIFPGTDLIITHETGKRPADTRLLRKIAEHYLL